MTVTQWMTRHPGRTVTLHREASLDDVVERMFEQPGVRDLYVVDGQTILGHISHRKIAHLLLAEHRREQTRRQLMDRISAGAAQDLMNPHFTSARSDEQLDNVLDRMLEHDIEDLPVVDAQKQLVGAISLTTVLQAGARQEL